MPSPQTPNPIHTTRAARPGSAPHPTSPLASPAEPARTTACQETGSRGPCLSRHSAVDAHCALDHLLAQRAHVLPHPSVRLHVHQGLRALSAKGEVAAWLVRIARRDQCVGLRLVQADDALVSLRDGGPLDAVAVLLQRLVQVRLRLPPPSLGNRPPFLGGCTLGNLLPEGSAQRLDRLPHLLHIAPHLRRRNRLNPNALLLALLLLLACRRGRLGRRLLVRPPLLLLLFRPPLRLQRRLLRRLLPLSLLCSNIVLSPRPLGAPRLLLRRSHPRLQLLFRRLPLCLRLGLGRRLRLGSSLRLGRRHLWRLRPPVRRRRCGRRIAALAATAPAALAPAALTASLAASVAATDRIL
mmetsp:Transcript_46182/g.148805  ORF Transcript_46182/g.148805 Transcript_46182/m.148805 type:complete len:354 (-) Transcript_46182:272-1333(-)